MWEFSLDSYWIKLPELPLERQLIKLLQYLPFSTLFFTETGTKTNYMWSILSPELVEWIKKDLNWVVIPVIQEYYYQESRINWFDSKKLQWVTPKVLKKEE